VRHLDLKRQLDELGATAEDVAAVIRAGPGRVEEWLAGSRPIPERRLEQIAWAIQHLRRGRALEASGLPSCPWLESWSPPSLDTGFAATRRAFKELEAHPATCPVCQERTRYLERHFGPAPPFPAAGGWRNLISGLVRFADAVPSPIYPPVVGAVAFALIIAIPGSVALVVAILKDPTQLQEHLVAGGRVVGLASAFGASGGVIFSLVRPFARHWGKVGEYITGVAAAFGYVTAMVWAWPLLDPDDASALRLDEPFTWIAIGFMSLAFGIAGTWGWRSANKGH
jgi:hypothetical protein